MSRRRLVVTVSAAVLLALGLLAALAVVSVTQTAFGRDQVRRFVQTRLANTVHGKLYVGAIRGSLIGGVTIDSLEIRDADDSLFLATGRIAVNYDPRDLIDRRILLQMFRADHPVLHIRKHANGDWNFRRIFPGSPNEKDKPNEERVFGDFIVIDSALVRNVDFTLTMPWHPDDSLHGARRDSAITFNLTRSDRTIRRTSEGFMRSWHWSANHLASNYIRLADPDSIGRFIALSDARIDESDPPFQFTNLRAGLKILGDSIWLEVPHFDLPASTGHGFGKIVWGSDLPIRYAIHVVGDSVALNDVAWVYPTLPTTGGGRMLLDIRNDPRNLNVIDYAIRRMDVRSTFSRLRGNMTFGVGAPILIVKDVSLDADPVDFRLIRALNGKPFPYDWAGTLTGHVAARGGPLKRFRVDSANVVFRDAHVPGATTVASGKGELDILFPAFTAFHSFHVSIARLDLRTPQFLNPNFPRLQGTVAGSATLDSSWLDVRFRDADITHFDGGAGESTHMTGNGRVTWGEKFLTYDLNLQALPLSFTELARSYPMVSPRGAYRGPIRVTGTMEDLGLVATLTGPAGAIAVDGKFDLYPPGFAASGRATVTHLDTRALFADRTIPPTDLTARFDLALIGDSLSNVLGGMAVTVDRSMADSIRIYAGRARLRFADRKVYVDTMNVETSAATASATGAFGLSADRPDSLRFSLAVDSLGGLRRYLSPTVAPGAVVASAPGDTATPGRGRDGVTAAEGTGRPPMAVGEPVAATPDTLAGTLALRGTLYGSIDTMDVSGQLGGHGLAIGSSRADTLHGSFEVNDLQRERRGTITADLDTLMLAGVRLTHLGGNLTLLDRTPLGGQARFAVTAASENGPRASFGGSAAWSGRVVSLSIDTATTQLGDDTWRLVHPALVVTDSGGVRIDSLALTNGRGGRLAASGALPLDAPVSFFLTADSIPLSDVGTLLQAPVPYRGWGRLSWRITGMRAAPAMRITAALAEPRFGSVHLERLTADGQYADRRLTVNAGLFYAGRAVLTSSALLPVDLALLPTQRRLLDEPLSGTIRADSVQLAILEAFTPALRNTRGTLLTRVDVGGTWRQPTLQGEISVANGATSLPMIGIGLRSLTAGIRFAGDSLTITKFSALSHERHGGRISLSGGVNFADFQNPRFRLRLDARGFNAIDKPRVAHLDLSTGADGLQLDGSLRRSRLTGELRVPQGDIYIPQLTTKRVISLEDEEFYKVVDTTLSTNRGLLPQKPSPLLDSLVTNMSLENVQVSMGDDVWLRSSEANIKLGGAVAITSVEGTSETQRSQLALTGTLTADRGTYRLNLGPVQRTFVVQPGGTLRFFGDRDLNPTLNISAIHTVRQFNVNDARQFVQIKVIIAGTLAQPELTLSSGDPNLQLSQSDLLSYLVTGQPSFDINTLSTGYTQTAASVLLPSIGSYFGDKLAGGWFDVVQLQTAGIETGAGNALTGSNVLSGTSFTLGKQISDRTFLSANAGLCGFGQAVRGGSITNVDQRQLTAALGAKVEHRLNNGFSVSFGIDPATSALACVTPEANRGIVQTPRQVGFDLFREWQF